MAKLRRARPVPSSKLFAEGGNVWGAPLGGGMVQVEVRSTMVPSICDGKLGGRTCDGLLWHEAAVSECSVSASTDVMGKREAALAGALRSSKVAKKPWYLPSLDFHFSFREGSGMMKCLGLDLRRSFSSGCFVPRTTCSKQRWLNAVDATGLFLWTRCAPARMQHFLADASAHAAAVCRPTPPLPLHPTYWYRVWVTSNSSLWRRSLSPHRPGGSNLQGSLHPKLLSSTP